MRYGDIFTKPVYYGEKYIKKNYPIIYKEILSKPQDLTFKEKLYWTIHEINGYPTCPICGNRTKFNTMYHGYYKYCSLRCSNNSPEVISKKECTSLLNHGIKHYTNIEKSKQTKLERYGDENYTNHEKAEKTCLERYGVKTNLLTKGFREQSKQTKLERYGDENYTNHEKAEKTCLERYGVKTNLLTKGFREQSKQTKLERYGDENYTNHEKAEKTCLERYGVKTNLLVEGFREQSKQIMLKRYGDPNYNNREKCKQTNLKRYGVKCTLQDPGVKEKAKITKLKRYGVEYNFQRDEILQKTSKILRNKIFKKYPYIIDIIDNQYICQCPHPECKYCNEKQYITNNTTLHNRSNLGVELCTKLLPINISKSSNTGIEIFVKMILDRYNIEYQTNVRNIIPPQELDIYIPSKKIAIECNGIYWHSTHKKSNDYHYNKFIKCQSKDILLITFWEDQILNKPDYIENIILKYINNEIEIPIDDYYIDLNDIPKYPWLIKNGYTKIDEHEQCWYIDNEYNRFDHPIQDKTYQIYDCGVTIYKKLSLHIK